MNPVDSKKRSIEIFRIVSSEISKNKSLGNKIWGNPSGVHEEQVYEIDDGEDRIWVTFTSWSSASSFEENRKVILTSYPLKDNSSIGQIMEICFPFEFSKKFNTRLYEENGEIEVRIYGKFTVGRSGLKVKYFFDYLRENGHSNEIFIDEEGKEYVCIFKLSGDKVEGSYISKRLIFYTEVISDYKKYWRKKKS